MPYPGPGQLPKIIPEIKTSHMVLHPVIELWHHKLPDTSSNKCQYKIEYKYKYKYFTSFCTFYLYLQSINMATNTNKSTEGNNIFVFLFVSNFVFMLWGV